MDSLARRARLPWAGARACARALTSTQIFGARGLYSSVVERQSCKLKVLGSIPSGGLSYMLPPGMWTAAGAGGLHGQSKGSLVSGFSSPELFVQFIHVILQLRAVGTPTSLQIAHCNCVTANEKRICQTTEFSIPSVS